jgi:hypothetical protein
MIHKTQILGFALDELAVKIGDLRYDALAEFLKKLAQKIEADAQKDGSRGRVKLATSLHNTAHGLAECSQQIKQAWVICEPYT